ncbi:hypothetical protein Tco_0299057 [Tanacetum coccineum]
MRTYLNNNDQPLEEKSMVVLLAEERTLKAMQTLEEKSKIQSLLNRANSIIFLIEEFTGKLAPIDPIPPGIVEADPEEDIRQIEKLLNDDSSPHSLEELNYEILILLSNLSPHLLSPLRIVTLLWRRSIYFLLRMTRYHRYESFHIDFYNVPSSPRPPKNPLDDDTGVSTTKVVDDIYAKSTRELYVHVPNVFPTLHLVFDTLLPFSSENKDKVFNPGILISNKEKSPYLLSHRGFKVFQLINDSESPMMIYGGDIPILDVPFLYFYPP